MGDGLRFLRKVAGELWVYWNVMHLHFDTKDSSSVSFLKKQIVIHKAQTTSISQ